MLLRTDPRELLLLEVSAYIHGFRLLTAEYPDSVADRVVEAILAVHNSAEDIRIAQVPGRVLVAIRGTHAELVLADLATRIRAVLPPDSSPDAIRDGAH